MNKFKSIEPKLVVDKQGPFKGKPNISIVIPVYNQQFKIKKNIDSILHAMSLPFELLVIDDGSTDETLYILEAIFNKVSIEYPLLGRIRLFKFLKSVFETKCDAFGFLASRANYVLEIQADMTINEKGFDARMMAALKRYEDLLMVSGRGTERIEPIHLEYIQTLGAVGTSNSFLKHIIRRVLKQFQFFLCLKESNTGKSLKNSSDWGSFHSKIFPNIDEFNLLGRAGYLGDLVESSAPILENLKNKIWIGETVMRGPILVDKNKYFEVGGLDSEKFFLGYDDHDLCLRAWAQKNYRSGYIPIDFSSPLRDGASRKMRTINQEFEIVLNLLRINKSRKKSTIYEAHKLLDDRKLKLEIREF